MGVWRQNRRSAQAIAATADGVIVGSVLVQAMADNQQTPENIPNAVGSLLSAIRTAWMKRYEQLVGSSTAHDSKQS